MSFIKLCALPECSKPFNNWRMSCCCRSHNAIYAGRMRHGTIENLPKTSAERKAHWSNYISRRRKKRNLSMPTWADEDKIKHFYTEAALLTEKTGIKHEVDHIIPSNHPLVCGLHNEFNLQVLPWQENRQKSNKFSID